MPFGVWLEGQPVTDPMISDSYNPQCLILPLCLSLIFLLLPSPMCFQCPLFMSSFFKYSIFFFFIFLNCLLMSLMHHWNWERYIFFPFPLSLLFNGEIAAGPVWVFSCCFLPLHLWSPTNKVGFLLLLFLLFSLVETSYSALLFFISIFLLCRKEWRFVVLLVPADLCWSWESWNVFSFGTKGAVQLASGYGNCGFRYCCWITS